MNTHSNVLTERTTRMENDSDRIRRGPHTLQHRVCVFVSAFIDYFQEMNNRGNYVIKCSFLQRSERHICVRERVGSFEVAPGVPGQLAGEEQS